MAKISFFLGILGKYKKDSAKLRTKICVLASSQATSFDLFVFFTCFGGDIHKFISGIMQ